MKERVNIRKMMRYYAMLFSIGSIMGWCLEVVFRTVCESYLRIPGFLLGPYCPIYGIGIVVIVAFCSCINFVKFVLFGNDFGVNRLPEGIKNRVKNFDYFGYEIIN